jgi:hypothetical protein
VSKEPTRDIQEEFAKAINLTTIIKKHNAEAALILYTLF